MKKQTLGHQSNHVTKSERVENLWKKLIRQETDLSDETITWMTRRIRLLTEYMAYGCALIAYRKQNGDFYMARATLVYYEARKASERGEVPVGAVVVCKDRIIARAHNLTETLTDVTAHAEMQAITAAASTLGGKYLNECTLYVTVEPCVMCAGAIAWAQMGRLVFGAGDEKRGYQRYASQALHPKTAVSQGVLGEECAVLMKDFFAAKRR